MRPLALPLVASLLFSLRPVPAPDFQRSGSGSGSGSGALIEAPSTAAEPPVEAELVEDAQAHAHAHEHGDEHGDEARSVALRETGAPVPADVKAAVRKGKDGDWQVRLARRGQLVALRYGGARVAGRDEAVIAVPAEAADPVVWETTRLDTLATVRGTLRLSGARAALRLAEAPAEAGRAEGRLHVCAAHEDGAGGFTVLCRVRAPASAANVSGDDAGADVWSVPDAGGSVVRMDLPASPPGFAASVMGYPAGVDGVVLRAEASRAAGEDRPVLTMLASERAQPQVPRRVFRYICDCF